MTDMPGLGQRADCVQLAAPDPLTAGAWLWAGVANQCTVRFVTSDPDLVAYIRPITGEWVVGAELVDGTGTQLTTSVQLLPGAPSAVYPSVDPDELLNLIHVRLNSGVVDPDTTELIRRLDLYLSAGGDLPDAWHHPDYEED